MATPQKRRSTGSSGSTRGRGSSSASSKSAAPKTGAKARVARPGEGEPRGSSNTSRKGKTIQEETEIGEDYESGRRDALP